MTLITKTIASLALALTMALTLAPASQATVFTFNEVEGTLPGTLSVDVTGTGDTAFFTFSNTDTLGSSLTNIYWDFSDDAAFDTLTFVAASSGVDFLDNASNLIASTPANMPGWDTVGFSSDFSVQADNPGKHNGINGGEFLTLALTLNDGYDTSWLLAALQSGDVNVGIHAVSIGAEELSASGMTATPIPAAAWLLGSGMLGLLGLQRRNGT